MKKKEYDCPHCGSKCKYRGSRMFYCKKCDKTYDVLRETEPRRATPAERMMGLG